MNNFNHSYRNLGSSPHLFGILLIVAGLFALVSPYIIGTFVSPQQIWIVGGIALILGVAITQSFGGILIDYKKNSMMEYYSFFGIKRGDWEMLPTINSVRVKEVTRTESNVPNGVSPTLSGKVTYYNVTLINPDQPSVLTLSYNTKKKAISRAKELASNFAVEMAIA